MNIRVKEVTVRELYDGYEDKGEEGVVGYHGLLDIRPKYQREFVYKSAQRAAVIDTLRKGYPLNVMYWAKTPTGWEVLDGQQRILSICQFLHREFSVPNANGNPQFVHNVEASNPAEFEAMMDYRLSIYECDGTDDEKLEWFRTINIAGAVLTDQELRNAVYAGTWLTDAKRRFSKHKCAAYNTASEYMRGDVIRQDYLETALRWAGERDGITIEEYMARHQGDADANALWVYFQDIISWVKSRFPEYRKEMRGVDWGSLYRDYRDAPVNSDALERDIKRLMADEDVTKKAGIYPYLFTGDERHLSIRAFTPKMRREAYERQGGHCPLCEAEGLERVYELAEMEADHIVPWSKGGPTTSENCQMLCKSHNRSKSNR